MSLFTQHFQFTRPLGLLLLLGLPYFYWLHRRTVTDMSTARKRVALALRLILITLLVLALAGLRYVQPGDALAVVFVVDGSKSVRDDQRAAIEKYMSDAARTRRQVDKVGVITFAQDPHTQSTPGQPFDASRLRDPGIVTATDIEKALRFAKIELDSTAKDAGKRVVLISDGNQTAGNALQSVRELAAAHIVLDTVTVNSDVTREALVDRMVMPPRVKIGEPFPVRVVISSLTAQTATVTLQKDGKPTQQPKRVELHPGKNVVVFEQNIDKAGFSRYSATLDAPEDTIAENNRGEGFVWVQGKPTVLYVADSPALTGFLRSALTGENITVEYAPPSALPTSAAALQRFDSVFLSNVRAGDLSLPQMTALQVSCRDFGVGFGMVGGEGSFGAGGYKGTPIEDTLPVSLEVKKQKRIPSVAVALVIEDLEIQSTVNMSIEAAKATMDLLEAIDQVGVLDCNGGFGGFGDNTTPSGTWRIQMQHVTDREALKSQMQSLQNMGDPPSYTPFLLEAARVLNNTDAKVKHIVFLGDGDAIYEANQATVAASLKRVRDMGITVSTITTGATSPADVRFMQTIAFAGGGQAYLAEKPQDLPRLLLKDQQTISQPPIIEEPFNVVPVAGDEVFKGIDWSSAPPLLGYNISNIKATAETSLISHRQDPIFAGWRYGLGRSVAFTSDDRAKWGAQWLGWSGYSKFWAQAVRWTLRPFAPSDYSTQVVMDGTRGHVIVDALDEQGHYVNRLQFQGRIAQPMTGGIKSPPTEEKPLSQTGPGRYETWFDAPQIGTYLVNVLQKKPDGHDSATVLGLSTPYSPEYKSTQSNRFLMNQLAQAGMGRADPPAGAVFTADRPPVFAPTDMVRALVLAAMFLLLFDIAIRRIAIDWADVRHALAWIARPRARQPVASRAATPELSRLMERKQGAVDRRTAELGDAPQPAIPPMSTPREARPATAAGPVEAAVRAA
ncbi:MAG TPA: VWA domain-containing protein, partial [Chthonomonadaceae bacterium]|nr:VWA domain-containing protein [Chthonomonadaceae bacterium]